MSEAVYMEIHRAREMFTLIKNSMSLLDKVDMNMTIKNSIKTDLNKVMQWLSLKDLKTIKEE